MSVGGTPYEYLPRLSHVKRSNRNSNGNDLFPDETRVATRLRNRHDGIAAGGHVRLSDDAVGFRQLFDTGRTESEEKDVRQERTFRYDHTRSNNQVCQRLWSTVKIWLHRENMTPRTSNQLTFRYMKFGKKPLATDVIFAWAQSNFHHRLKLLTYPVGY